MSADAVEQYRVRLREALSAIEKLRGKLDGVERGKSEPLAIVGLACRFPGGGDGPEAYWQLLERGVDAVREIPAQRWPGTAIPGHKPEVSWAALLDRVDGFDAAFFGISPREAERLDPQQRLLLEVVWESLEDAGLRPETLVGAPVGIFVGLNSLDYQHRLMRLGIEHVDAYTATGNLLSTAAGRISYTFGFQGPCMSIDTACSSSLVSIAMACQSLRAGDCDVAVAGGITLLLSPYTMALAAGTQALSIDGRCKTLDARANGFVRGEGCGMVILKRLSDAQRDGDTIRALIRGWAINQDGRSSGLTAPNVLSQQSLLRRALEHARVSAADIGYVEMHGTGTPLGDPIEAEALREVIGRPRKDGSACVLGAVKTNLGHLEAAAGVAGLIKAVLALEHEAVPQNLHFRRLNPRVSLDGTPFVVPTQRIPWPRGPRRRIAGVSSFGISGTNAHVVLEEAPQSEPGADASSPSPRLVVLSARSEAALSAQAARLRRHLESQANLDLADLAFTLATARSPMEHRLALVVSSRDELAAALESAAQGDTPAGAARGTAGAASGKRAFLFTGQGAQVPGMGRGLCAAWPEFREAFDRCAGLFDQALGRDLRAVMGSPPDSSEAAPLDQTEFTQPALFTMEYALAALWRSWGVEPDLLAGHSIGELAAACVAGVFSLEDGVRLVAARARLMQRLPAGGAMVSIEATESEVAAAVLPHRERVSIAAVNGPQQVVIAGAAEPVRALAEAFAARGVRTKAIRVSHAFHSPQMEPMLAEFRHAAKEVTYHLPDRPLVSNLTGRIAGPEIATPDYWVQHVREAVRFKDSVQALREAGAGIFVEIGPKPTLLGLVPAILPETPPMLVPSLRPGQDETVSALSALGRLWAEGAAARVAAPFASPRRRVRLPTYAWQRERFWIEVPDTAPVHAEESTGHPLLGWRFPAAGTLAAFETTLGLYQHAWLADHRIAGQLVVPGAAIAELVFAAAAHGAERTPHVTALVLQAPLLLPETGARRVQVVLTAGAGEAVTAAVYSQPSGSGPGVAWELHATATLSVPPAPPPPLDLSAAKARCTEALDPGAVYAHFADVGLAFGPAFQGLRSLFRGEGEAVAEVVLPPRQSAAGYGVPPMLLDAALQAVAAAVPAADADALLLPFEIGGFAVYTAGVDAAWVYVRMRSGGGLVVDVTLADARGTVLAEVTGLRLQRADREKLRRSQPAFGDEAFFALKWQNAPLPPAPAAQLDGLWIVVSDSESAAAAALSTRLARWVRCAPAELAGALAASSPVAGIVCLWESGSEPVAAAAQRLAADCLQVVHALHGGTPVRLWWVTTGAVAVYEGAPVSVAAAPVWGIGRTVMQEHPELACRLVDLLPGPASVDALVRELVAQDGEDQVAWRADGRFVARLLRAQAPAVQPPLTLPVRGTVLVTGGLGALGRHVAHWLAAGGVPHLLLTSRRGSDTPGCAETIAQLEALGARVTVAAVDVADRLALQALLQAIPADLPLRGVVHTAGVLADGVLASQSRERFARVLSPKVDGAWNLHELTAGCELEFFVLFSSLAGLLGSAGQANYAAANSFLDALALHRRALGLPAQSLAWGAWSEGGMAAALDAAQQARWARQGMGVLAPAQGIAMLERALQLPDALLGLVSLDLRALSRALGAKVPPAWRALVRAPSTPVSTAAPGAWAARLAAQPLERQLEEVRTAIQTEVSRVLSLGASSAVPLNRPLQELGLDSLMAVELRNALAQRVGAPLPATLAFDYPTIEALTHWLLQKFVAGARPAAKEIPVARSVAEDEPIAIVGMACRLPGGVTDPKSFWRLLEQEVDAISEVPRSRWDVDALYDPDPDAPGKVTTRCGGFLADIDRFDAAFFGISPREATAMDPQQRLLLETSWEALEDAGLVPQQLLGSDTGVFVGLMYQEYGSLTPGLEALDGYVSTGTAGSVASGRISYVLGLKGPSLTVDTACSSSLVTVHLACQALRQGECAVALAGGVAVMLKPTVFVEFSRLRGLAADGRCKPFSAAADGVGWSEGCGMLVLKRLRDARQQGDRVLAVIRGSAVNQDGRSNGLTAPNGPSQEAVIQRALAQAGLGPGDLDYVECHGTGTALGDPIEVQALGAVMSLKRPEDKPLLIGSVKSNLGHVQAAAGVTGIMKVVLAMQHQKIPRSLHSEPPSPHIGWSALPLRVAKQAEDWPRGQRPRRAGVSSFGVSGTNAHVVLEEAPPTAVTGPATERGPEIVVISARNAGALQAAATGLQVHLLAQPEQPLLDLAFSLAKTRSEMEHRLSIVASTTPALQHALAEVAAGGMPVSGFRGRQPAERIKLVWIFPGQGGQWPGMGRQLLEQEPVFRASLEATDAAIFDFAGWSVLQALRAEPAAANLGRIDVIQPVLFALQVAQAALLSAWGVRPDAVVGHSLGEVAAAHVAGALSLEDAVAVICGRSRLLLQRSGQGEMAVVELSLEDAEAALGGYQDRLSVAASNGPRTTVLSGDPAALEEVLAALSSRGIFCRRVKVDVASHSPQMDALRPALLCALAHVAPRPCAMTMLSTVTEERVQGPELTASYWAENLRKPVRFAPAVQKLMAQGYGLFVELSPHPVLTPAVQEMLKGARIAGVAVGTQRREQPERGTLLETLAALWVHGQKVSWEGVFSGRGRRVELPTYPWQRERYWIDVPAGQSRAAHSQMQAGAHPLLGEGRTVATQRDLHLWETILDLTSLPWLSDHRVHDQGVLPGAAYLEMALAAGAACLAGNLLLSSVEFVEALSLPGSGQPAPRVQLVAAEAAGSLRFEIASQPIGAASAAWTTHARGLLRPAERPADLLPIDLAAVRARLGGPVSAQTVYAALAARGLPYGPAFQGIVELWQGPGEALGRVRLPQAAGSAGPYQIHPALLDACFQILVGAMDDGQEDTWLPIEMGAFGLLQRPPAELWCYARIAAEDRSHSIDRRRADLLLVHADGTKIAEVSGLVVRRLARRLRPDDADRWFLQLDWEPAAPPGQKVRAGRFLLLGEGGGLAALLRSRLEAQGHAVVHAVAGSPVSLPSGTCPLDDSSAAAVKALLGQAFAPLAPTGVVHLRSLDGEDALTPAAIEAALVRGCDSVLHTVQALSQMGWRDAPRLWLITRGAQAVDAGSISPAQAPLLGLGRVIALEHPELRCTRIDLDPAMHERSVDGLASELLGDAPEQELALRGAERLIARLTRRTPESQRRPGIESPAEPTVRRDGSYLITGGLGGLGLGIARWLAERGAGQLVLVSRSGIASEAQQEAVAALVATGSRVTVAKANVAVQSELAGVLDEILKSGLPLAGIVHAAGLLDDGLLLSQDPVRLRRVMAPKVEGALNLHALVRGLHLDFFVLYSSAAGLLGSPGQGNYAAANAFLDALAHHRRRRGLPALSIDWGAFSEVGLAAAQDFRGVRLATRGMRSLTPQEGLTALARLLATDTPQAAVVPLDVRQWVEFYPAAAASSLLSRLLAEQPPLASTDESERALRQQLDRSTPASRRSLVLDFVSSVAARVLRIPGGRLDVEAPLSTLGMDSLMGLELRNRIEAALGIRIPATLLWTYPTAAALAGYLAEQLSGSAADPPAPAAVPETPASSDPSLAQLAEDELFAVLDASLARAGKI